MRIRLEGTEQEIRDEIDRLSTVYLVEKGQCVKARVRGQLYQYLAIQPRATQPAKRRRSAAGLAGQLGLYEEVEGQP